MCLCSVVPSRCPCRCAPSGDLRRPSQESVSPSRLPCFQFQSVCPVKLSRRPAATHRVCKKINTSFSLSNKTRSNVLIFKVSHKCWLTVSKSEAFMLLFCRSESKLTFLKTFPAIFYSYVVVLWLIQQIKISFLMFFFSYIWFSKLHSFFYSPFLFFIL